MKFVGILCCCFITATSVAMDDHWANAAHINAQCQAQPASLVAATHTGGGINRARKLYNPRKWTTVTILTPKDILHSLRIINNELAETQVKLDHLSDQIPQDKKMTLDALLAKWCTDAQVYMEHVQHESKLAGAEAFMKAYKQQETVIAAQVAEIEQLIQSAQASEDMLAGLINGLSLNGQVTDDVLIGDLEDLSLGE